MKSNERLDWTDLGEYAHEILIRHGESHPVPKYESMLDYVWHDPTTDDSLRLWAANSGPESEYYLEIADGSLIDHRRKYGFSAKKSGIQVFDDNYQRLEEEEAAQRLLESLVMQRLDTAGVARPETNLSGRRQFWNIAAMYAIENVVNDTIISQLARLEENKLKNLFRENIVDIVIAREEYRYIPKASVYSAIIQKGHEALADMSQKQLEAKKED